MTLPLDRLPSARADALAGAYAASALLAVIALVTLLSMTLLSRRKEAHS